MAKNLNLLKIDTDKGPLDLTNYNVNLDNAAFEKAEVYFRNLDSALIQKIIEFRDGLIFGSIAWLTSDIILDALAQCENVQIVVQKEDFLRPDINSPKNISVWKQKLRKKYSALKFSITRYECQKPICDLSILGDPNVDPVRCLGNHNASKKYAMPRAHNKFLVFCEFVKRPPVKRNSLKENVQYRAVAVWTGSFNLTKNAAMSFENALYIEERSGANKVIDSYLKEHHQIFALSEPLDWTSNYVEPEYRIGT